MIGRGQLRHRWWGDYSAVLALDFGEVSAPVLQELIAQEFPGWQVLARGIIGRTVSSAELKAEKAHLARLGADPAKIDSIRFSIDYGEPFLVDVPPPADAVQLGLL